MSEITLPVVVIVIDLGHNQELVKEGIVGGVNEVNASKRASSLNERGRIN